MHQGKRYTARDMEALRAERGGRCEVCGSLVRLEWAHVQPTGLAGRGRGLQRRYLDVKRHPCAYRLLCHACHWAQGDHVHWTQKRPFRPATKSSLEERLRRNMAGVEDSWLEDMAPVEALPW
jgi:hypothetical protein